MLPRTRYAPYPRALTLPLRFRCTPATTITPPETPAQTGFASAVTWTGPEFEMLLSARGLVDTPETAYTFGPAGFSYLDVDPGVAYTEFDWSMADA